MRWLWCKRERDDSDYERAHALLQKARADEVRVAQIVQDTQEALHKNNFGPKIRSALGVQQR